MQAGELSTICEKALAEEKYVYLTHRGVGRDVFPYRIRDGKLYCWCSLHTDREVEGMWLENIGYAQVSSNDIGLSFPYPSDFEP